VAKTGEYEVFQKDALATTSGYGNHVHTYTTTVDGTASFGELALLHPQPCLASVVCKTGGTVFRMDCAAFRALVTGAVDKKRKSSISK